MCVDTHVPQQACGGQRTTLHVFSVERGSSALYGKALYLLRHFVNPENQFLKESRRWDVVNGRIHELGERSERNTQQGWILEGLKEEEHRTHSNTTSYTSHALPLQTSSRENTEWSCNWNQNISSAVVLETGNLCVALTVPPCLAWKQTIS